MKKIIIAAACVILFGFAAFFYFTSSSHVLRKSDYKNFVRLKEIETDAMKSLDKQCYFALDQTKTKYTILELTKPSFFRAPVLSPLISEKQLEEASGMIPLSLDGGQYINRYECLIYYLPVGKIDADMELPYHNVSYRTWEFEEGTVLAFLETHRHDGNMSSIENVDCALNKIEKLYPSSSAVIGLFN